MDGARSANVRQPDCQDKLYTGICCTKRKPGKPRKNWIDTIQQDLKNIGITWEVGQQLAVNRKAGVDVWPIVSSTRDELRSMVR